MFLALFGAIEEEVRRLQGFGLRVPGERLCSAVEVGQNAVLRLLPVRPRWPVRPRRVRCGIGIRRPRHRSCGDAAFASPEVVVFATFTSENGVGQTFALASFRRPRHIYPYLAMVEIADFGDANPFPANPFPANPE